MRCKSCNVDLNETAAQCPLCGGPAQNIPPLITGVAFQDYPACKGGLRPRSRQNSAMPARGGMMFGEKMRARFHF